MRPRPLFLALIVLAFASLIGVGSASACGKVAQAPAPQVQAQIDVGITAAESASFVVAWRQQAEAAIRYHHGTHPHGHGAADGCCAVCCSFTAPHVLIQDIEVVFERPVVRAFFGADPAADAKALSGLPFRPPRTV